MNIIKCDDKNNKIIGFNPELINTHILFRGKNNRLFCEENVKLKDSVLEFSGDNSIIYLSSNRNNYFLKISIYNNSVFYIDENNYINGNGGLNCSLSEEKNIFIGKECLFSFGIWMRLADPHLIYDSIDMKRINFSKSIYLGDHIWIGQDSLILKGTHIGSGSIIGAKSVLSNKKVNSNTMWAGVPAKEIRKNVFFDGASVHAFTKNETEKSINFSLDKWIFKNEGFIMSFEDIEEKINDMKSIDEKISFIQYIRNCKNKNRFYI